MDEYKGVKIRSKYQKYEGLFGRSIFQSFVVFFTFMIGGVIGFSINPFLGVILPFLAFFVVYKIFYHTVGFADTYPPGHDKGSIEISPRKRLQELENIERQPNYEEYKRRYDNAKKYLMYKTSYLELIQTVGNRHFTSDENELLKIGSKVFWSFGEDSEEVRKPFIEELLDKYDSEELDNLSSEMERIWRGDNNGYLDEYNSQIKKYNRRLQKGKRRRKRKKS